MPLKKTFVIKLTCCKPIVRLNNIRGSLELLKCLQHLLQKLWVDLRVQGCSLNQDLKVRLSLCAFVCFSGFYAIWFTVSFPRLSGFSCSARHCYSLGDVTPLALLLPRRCNSLGKVTPKAMWPPRQCDPPGNVTP